MNRSPFKTRDVLFSLVVVFCRMKWKDMKNAERETAWGCTRCLERLPVGFDSLFLHADSDYPHRTLGWCLHPSAPMSRPPHTSQSGQQLSIRFKATLDQVLMEVRESRSLSNELLIRPDSQSRWSAIHEDADQRLLPQTYYCDRPEQTAAGHSGWLPACHDEADKRKSMTVLNACC